MGVTNHFLDGMILQVYCVSLGSGKLQRYLPTATGPSGCEVGLDKGSNKNEIWNDMKQQITGWMWSIEVGISPKVSRTHLLLRFFCLLFRSGVVSCNTFSVGEWATSLLQWWENSMTCPGRAKGRQEITKKRPCGRTWS